MRCRGCLLHIVGRLLGCVRVPRLFFSSSEASTRADSAREHKANDDAKDPNDQLCKECTHRLAIVLDGSQVRASGALASIANYTGLAAFIGFPARFVSASAALDSHE